MGGLFIYIITIVEVRGVEPRSEEKTPKISTRVSCFWISCKGTPAGRIYLAPAQVIRFSTDSFFLLEYEKELSRCSRRSVQASREIPE
jgi:hypothetical protein